MSYSLGAFVSAPFSGGRVEGQVTKVRRNGKVRISRATLARTGLSLGTVWRREAQLTAASGPAPLKMGGKVLVFPAAPKTEAAPATKRKQSLGGRILAFVRRAARAAAAIFA